MSNLQIRKASRQDVKAIQDPPITQALFGRVRWAWVWRILRLYVGY